MAFTDNVSHYSASSEVSSAAHTSSYQTSVRDAQHGAAAPAASQEADEDGHSAVMPIIAEGVQSEDVNVDMPGIVYFPGPYSIVRSCLTPIMPCSLYIYLDDMLMVQMSETT